MVEHILYLQTENPYESTSFSNHSFQLTTKKEKPKKNKCCWEAGCEVIKHRIVWSYNLYLVRLKVMLPKKSVDIGWNVLMWHNMQVDDWQYCGVSCCWKIRVVKHSKDFNVWTKLFILFLFKTIIILVVLCHYSYYYYVEFYVHQRLGFSILNMLCKMYYFVFIIYFIKLCTFA